MAEIPGKRLLGLVHARSRGGTARAGRAVASGGRAAWSGALIAWAAFVLARILRRRADWQRSRSALQL